MEMERIVKRFYDELENGKIMGRKCKACGAVEFPPVIACNACGHFETEWFEMSGEGVVTDIVMPSPMTNPRCDVFAPFGLCCVTLKEGREINAIVRGVTPETEAGLKSGASYPVKASIFQRDGFKTVVYDMVVENGGQ
jgi:uncharacterized OB-fold protein